MRQCRTGAADGARPDRDGLQGAGTAIPSGIASTTTPPNGPDSRMRTLETVRHCQGIRSSIWPKPGRRLLPRRLIQPWARRARHAGRASCSNHAVTRSRGGGPRRYCACSARRTPRTQPSRPTRRACALGARRSGWRPGPAYSPPADGRTGCRTRWPAGWWAPTHHAFDRERLRSAARRCCGMKRRCSCPRSTGAMP